MEVSVAEYHSLAPNLISIPPPLVGLFAVTAVPFRISFLYILGLTGTIVPLISSISYSKLQFTETSGSIFPAISTNTKGSACPYPYSLSGRVSRIEQLFDAASGSSFRISLSIEYPATKVSLTSAGVKSGFASKVRATIPAINGVAMLVPLLLV